MGRAAGRKLIKNVKNPLMAIRTIKEISNAGFDETLEIHARLNLAAGYNDQQFRASVILPKGTGKIFRVAVISRSGKFDEAQKSGADVIGSYELIKEISEGFLDFDKLIATPDM